MLFILLKVKKLRDNIKQRIREDPVVKAKKMFEEEVDKIRDSLGWFISFVLCFHKIKLFNLDESDRIEFDLICPQFYQFLTNINYWKRCQIPR